MEFGSHFERSIPSQVVAQDHHGVNIYGAFGDYQRSGQLRQYAIAEREDNIANAKKKLENQADVIPKLKQNCEKLVLEIKVEEALTATEIGLKLKQERQANQIEANYEEYLDELEQVKANHCRFVQYENSRKSKLQNVERDYIERCKKIPEVCSLINATNELNNLNNRLQTVWKNLNGLRQEVQQMKTESHTNWKTFQQVCIEVARNEKAKSLHRLNTEQLEAKKKQLKTRKEQQDAEKRLMDRKIQEAGGYPYSPMRYDPYARYGYQVVNRSPYMVGGMKHSPNATQWKQYVNKISLQQQNRGGSLGRSDPLTTRRFPETVSPMAQLRNLMSPGSDSQHSRFGPSSRVVYPATPNPTARQFSQVSLPPTTPASLAPTTPGSLAPTTPGSLALSTLGSLPPVTPVSLPPVTPVSLPPVTPVSLPPVTPVSLPPVTPVSLPPITPVSLPPETPESFSSTQFSLSLATQRPLSSTPFSLPPANPASLPTTRVPLPPKTPEPITPAAPVSLPPAAPVSLPPAAPVSLHPTAPVSLPPAAPVSLPPKTPEPITPAAPVSLPPAAPVSLPPTAPVSLPPISPGSLPPAAPVSLPPATPLFKSPFVLPTQSEPCNIPDSPFSIASQPLGLSAPSPMNFSMFGDPQQTVPSTEGFGGGFMGFFGGAGGGETGNAESSSFFFDMGNSTQGSDVSSFF